MAPVDERDTEFLSDEQRAKARAVDEQLAFNPSAAFEYHGGDEAALAVALDAGDAAFGACRALPLGAAAQVSGIAPGVELEGVSDLAERRIGVLGRRPGHLAGLRRDGGYRIGIKVGRIAERAALEPVMVELDPTHIRSIESERVDIAMAKTRPVDELDAQLVGRVRFADELVLVDPEHGVEQVDLRDRRLADADGADGFGFDQLDFKARKAADDFRQRGRGHPAGSSAADDHDFTDRVTDHAAISSAAQAPAMRRNCCWLGSASAALR